MIIRSAIILVAVAAIGSLSDARAEGGCPPGQIPYTATPAPGSAASIASCGPMSSASPAKAKWATRWGAIATDVNAPAIGASNGHSSEARAKKGALAECKKQGGQNCVLDSTYHDQCAALVAGAKVMNINTAATIDEAEALATSKCSSSDTGCQTLYTGCSLPEQTR